MQVPFLSRLFLPRLLAHLGIAGVLVFSTACSSIEYAPDKAPRMVVVNDQTPFFVHGPSQGGVDRFLLKGDEVQVLRQDFGYSFVVLDNGQKGYMANEALVPAPPERPAPSPIPEAKPFSDESNAPAPPPTFRY